VLSRRALRPGPSVGHAALEHSGGGLCRGVRYDTVCPGAGSKAHVGAGGRGCCGSTRERVGLTPRLGRGAARLGGANLWAARLPLVTRGFLAYPWHNIMAIALNITSLSPGQLRKAADLQEQIQGLRAELNQLLGGELPGAPGPVVAEAAAGPTKARKKFSAETRAKMAAAQKARWAAKTGVSVARPIEVKAEEAPPAKKKASPALLKALAKARKARWAKVRAAN